MKFSLSVLLNKIDIHGTVLLQITIKPSITVLTNSFFITLPLNMKADSFITTICLSSLFRAPQGDSHSTLKDLSVSFKTSA